MGDIDLATRHPVQSRAQWSEFSTAEQLRVREFDFIEDVGRRQLAEPEGPEHDVRRTVFNSGDEIEEPFTVSLDITQGKLMRLVNSVARRQ